MNRHPLPLVLLILLVALLPLNLPAADSIASHVLQLPPGEGNPRNSEGDFVRLGCQYLSYSSDGGNQWSPLSPSSIRSPVSPASIERIPSTGDLLMVWNNHENIDPSFQGKRTPLTVAVSRDDGRTWEHVQNIQTNPHGWYCYTAMEFVDQAVLLAYCAGDRRENNGLAFLQISLLPVASLYGR